MGMKQIAIELKYPSTALKVHKSVYAVNDHLTGANSISKATTGFVCKGWLSYSDYGPQQDSVINYDVILPKIANNFNLIKLEMLLEAHGKSIYKR